MISAQEQQLSPKMTIVDRKIMTGNHTNDDENLPDPRRSKGT
jgi:hypothetical protein